MTLPSYVSREALMAATDITPSLAVSSQLDRILQATARGIDDHFHRHFYVLTEARTFDRYQQNRQHRYGLGSGFLLNKDLLSYTTVVVDDTTITSGIEVAPQEGPRYDWINQQGDVVTITGDWGYNTDTTSPAGALAEDLDGTETGVDVTDSSKIGTLEAIIVNSERMVVTARSLLDTTADLAADLTAVASDVTVTVDDGSLVNAGETITIESENMFVLSIAGNDLTVIRATEGTVLAAHTGTLDVYAPRTLTVERGALGSTAATHSSADAVVKYQAPPVIRELQMAEALTQFEQEKAGFGRTVGSGEGAREAAGKGIEDIRRRASKYRKVRLASI